MQMFEGVIADELYSAAIEFHTYKAYKGFALKSEKKNSPLLLRKVYARQNKLRLGSLKVKK